MSREFNSSVEAIREYFGPNNGGKEVSTQELRALSTEDRVELGALCASALGGIIKK